MPTSSILLPNPGASIGLQPFSANPTTKQIANVTNVNFGASVVVAGGVPFTIERTLTNAELAALSVTPITLLPAPGAGLRWVPLSMSASAIKTVASGGPSPSFRLRWAGNTTDLVTAFVLDLANAPRSFAAFTTRTSPTFASDTAANISNLALQLSASTGIGTSNALVTFWVNVVLQPAGGY